MALLTTTQQLENIEAAIVAIENGAQSYEIDGREFTRGTLSTYYRERRVLEKKLAAENGDRPVLSSLNMQNMGYDSDTTTQ